jgi:hypothetical protein
VSTLATASVRLGDDNRNSEGAGATRVTSYVNRARPSESPG